MSKNKQDLGPYRRKQFQTYFQFSLIAICFVIIFVLFYACTGSSKNDIDYTDAKVIQMDEPADDSPVVVFETNKGTFCSVTASRKICIPVGHSPLTPAVKQ